MRKTTKGHGLPGAVLVTVGMVLLMALSAGALLGACLGSGAGGFGLALGILCALLCVAGAGGVIAALVQRWREIEGGEEDEARKY